METLFELNIKTHISCAYPEKMTKERAEKLEEAFYRIVQEFSFINKVSFCIDIKREKELN